MPDGNRASLSASSLTTTLNPSCAALLCAKSFAMSWRTPSPHDYQEGLRWHPNLECERRSLG